MCGIAGVVRLDGSALAPGALRALKAMTDSMISEFAVSEMLLILTF